MSNDGKPLCFVLMPYGTKADPTGRRDIDFDRLFRDAIEPAIRDAGLLPIRADQEKAGGIIHKAMFERLMLCEYAVADLTTASANVFYELGVRHTARPATTQPIFARHQPIPFDVNLLRALPYDLGDDNAFGETEAVALRESLAVRLRTLRQEKLSGDPVDSPIFDLVSGWQPQIPARMRVDLFREQVRVVEERQRMMRDARAVGGDIGLEKLFQVEADLGSLDIEEAGIVVDLMLSYRAIEAWSSMISLVDKMPEVLRRQVLVREQLAFALNRRAGEGGELADRERALEILEKVVDEQGRSSETCGLMGRIYKDLWSEAVEGNRSVARGYLMKSIEVYKAGFEADSRDPYPGINAVTMLEMLGTRKALKERDGLIPVVRFAAMRRLRGRSPDYWDHATLLELAVLEQDQDAAEDYHHKALSQIREIWEAKTTVRNLRLIRNSREGRGVTQGWLNSIISDLDAEIERLRD